MDLQNELLRTLSFYEPMTLEHIFLDLDKSFLDVNEDLTTADLTASLAKLEKQALIKETQKDEQTAWIRIQPKKSLLRRLRDIVKL